MTERCAYGHASQVSFSVHVDAGMELWWSGSAEPLTFLNLYLFSYLFLLLPKLPLILLANHLTCCCQSLTAKF